MTYKPFKPMTRREWIGTQISMARRNRSKFKTPTTDKRRALLSRFSEPEQREIEARARGKNAHLDVTVAHTELYKVLNTKAGKHATRAHKYDITPAQLTEMTEKVGNMCPVCKREPTKHGFAVDHCHKSNKVRGLICTRCNSALGMVQDSPETLVALAEYLRAAL